MASKTLIFETAAVALISAAALAIGIQGAGIASGYVDPILKTGAQDEAVYGHASAVMANTGRWLTPVFLGRLMLNKPPLLMWSGALAMRMFGVNSIALRVAPIAAGALCCVLVYAWLRRSLSMFAAASGVLLLLGSTLFYSMARKFMTDILLTLCITAAMFVLSLDLRMQRLRTALAFGALAGAAILTKSAAGIIPLLILGVYCLVASGKTRPPVKHLVVTLAAAVLVAGPWHLYQFLVHRDWFVAEYIRFQLLGSGISAPSRYTSESNLSFYAARLVALDPMLLVLLFAAAVFWKRHADEDQARLVAVWCGAALVCPLAFGTRVAYYLLPLVPAMAIAAVQLSPWFRGRWAATLCGLLAICFGVKAWNPGMTWGLDTRRESVASAAGLEKYSRLRRANELVIVEPDDEFYSATLDLPKVRYAFLGIVDPTKTTEFFYWLGINVAARDFCKLDVLAPSYEQNLASWGLPDTKPIGTIIAGASNADLSAIVQCSAERDFFLPDDLRDVALASGGDAHIVTTSENGRFFLLAKRSQPRAESAHQPGTITSPQTPPR